RRLSGEKIAVLGFFGVLFIAPPPQATSFLVQDWPESLKARAAKSRVLREQEIAAPEALPRDGTVGLRVDCKQHTRRVIRLWHTPRQHQDVPVGIGVNGARAQRVVFQSYRIIIGVVVICLRSPVS